MRWYVGLFLFALLLFIGSHYNWFGLLKTDLETCNNKFKEICKFMDELYITKRQMSPEELTEIKKKVQIKKNEYMNIIKKLNKPDIIPHFKYISNIVLEYYKTLINLSDTWESLKKKDLSVADKMKILNDLGWYKEYYIKLKTFHLNIIVQIIRDNPDLEKDLLEINEPVKKTNIQ